MSDTRSNMIVYGDYDEDDNFSQILYIHEGTGINYSIKRTKHSAAFQDIYLDQVTEGILHYTILTLLLCNNWIFRVVQTAFLQYAAELVQPKEGARQRDFQTQLVRKCAEIL